MKKRVVITGAAGFIGSHLAETLLDRDYAVIGIDNLLTGDTANLSHLQNRDFTFIKHDVTNYIYIDGPVDYVLHWASPASPIDYLELPIPTLKVGALGTHKALGLAKAKNARFVIASTSEVYGDPLEHPQKETYWGNVNPVGPRGVYDEAKRFAEAMTMAYHRVPGRCSDGSRRCSSKKDWSKRSSTSGPRSDNFDYNRAVTDILFPIFEIVQVDDAGQLFISPALEQWEPIAASGIDVVIDLEG